MDLLQAAPYLSRNSKHLKASQQLGMPVTRAAYKLTRLLMFSMAKRLGLDTCFRCGFKITQVKEFSIEHKKAWRDVDSKLYWDLDNIAFSHFSCNAANGKRPNRKDAPAGMNWCGHCNEFRPVDKFYRNCSQRTGYNQVCTKHRKAEKAKTYKERISVGLCTRCPAQATRGRTCCQKHLNQHAAQTRARWKKKHPNKLEGARA
jgi:hypothetical protein